jgi:hypothetical protein
MKRPDSPVDSLGAPYLTPLGGGTPLPSDPRAAAALLARRDVQIESLRSNVAALEDQLSDAWQQNRLLQEQVRVCTDGGGASAACELQQGWVGS